jgi:hypothetical protein
MTVWHINVMRTDHEYHCFETMAQIGLQGDNAANFFVTSQDGLQWRTPSQPLLTARRGTGSWDDNRVYRMAGIPANRGDSVGYEVLYCAYGSDRSSPPRNRWHIGHGLVSFQGSWASLDFTLLDSNTLTPRDSLGSFATAVDAAGPGEVRKRNTVIRGMVTTLVMAIDAPWRLFVSDSLIVECGAAAHFDSLVLFYPSRSDSGSHTSSNGPESAKSSSFVWVSGTDFVSTDQVRVSLPLSVEMEPDEHACLKCYNSVVNATDHSVPIRACLKGQLHRESK